MLLLSLVVSNLGFLFLIFSSCLKEKAGHDTDDFPALALFDTMFCPKMIEFKFLLYCNALEFVFAPL